LHRFLPCPAAADSIRIGLVSEITGPKCRGRQLYPNGAKLAVDALNQKGGILGKRSNW